MKSHILNYLSQDSVNNYKRTQGCSIESIYTFALPMHLKKGGRPAIIKVLNKMVKDGIIIKKSYFGSIKFQLPKGTK